MYVQRWVIYCPSQSTYYTGIPCWGRWPDAKYFADPQEAGEHLEIIEHAHPGHSRYFQIIDVWVKEPCPTPPTV